MASQERRQETTVIIPTRNRPEALARTLLDLAPRLEEAAGCEAIVVDDGSSPPAATPPTLAGCECRVVRLTGAGRSAARNEGADAAGGDILVFIDDDMSVGPGFVRAHQQAHEAGADVLCVGSVRLAPGIAATPFGRFRQALEDGILEQVRSGSVPDNFCTAQNMSVSRKSWNRLGGFDVTLQSAEDQDLALRHVAHGGRIVFAPGAVAVHRDSVSDMRAYFHRTEWGARHMVPFCRKHPGLPDNIERERINGKARWAAEPIGLSLRKGAKRLLAQPPLLAGMLAVTAFLERAAPRGAVLTWCYRVLVGVGMLKGHRAGLEANGQARGA